MYLHCARLPFRTTNGKASAMRAAWNSCYAIAQAAARLRSYPDSHPLYENDDPFFLDDMNVPFPDSQPHSDRRNRPTVARIPARSAPEVGQATPGPVHRERRTEVGAGAANRHRPNKLHDDLKGLDTVQRRRALFSEVTGRDEAAAGGRHPIRQTDKRHLQKGQWQEVASRLRTEGASRRVFRVFRYAIDDLRLLKALEEAGMEGRVVVTDSVRDADVVLASAVKRSSKKVDVSEAEAAAKNAGIPFIRLPSLSAIRVMEAIAPLMGIPIPQHLLNRAKASSPYLPPPDPELQEVLALLDQCSLQQQRQAGERYEEGAVTVASVHDRLGPPPNLDWLDVDHPGDPPKQKGDMVGNKHPLLRAIKPGSKIRKKALQKHLAQQNAPW